MGNRSGPRAWLRGRANNNMTNGGNHEEPAMSETRRSNRGEGAAKLSNSMNGMRVVQRMGVKTGSVESAFRRKSKC